MGWQLPLQTELGLDLGSVIASCVDLGFGFFLFFKLEDNCFTMLCWFLPFNLVSSWSTQMKLLTLQGCVGVNGMPRMYSAGSLQASLPSLLSC